MSPLDRGAVRGGGGCIAAILGRMNTAVGLICGVGAMLLVADASAQSWRAEPEPRSHRSRHEDRRSYADDQRPARVERAPRQKTSSSTKPVRQQSAWTPAPAPTHAELVLVRCAAYRQELENVIRAEMAGGSPRGMAQLRARRQAIYEAQLDAGC